jgi:SAM-dependent methyltransferase
LSPVLAAPAEQLRLAERDPGGIDVTTKDYIFGYAGREVETRRLDLLEAFMDEGTFARLDRLIQRGDRCLDVAAGRGTAAVHMLSRCGASGEVVATDVDTFWIEANHHPNYHAVHHDIVTDPLDELGLFDVVHVRFVLHHLGRERGPIALQRCVQLLKPGGRLLVEEPFGALRADPGNDGSPTFDAVGQQWKEFIFSKVSLDLDFGLMLPRLLVENGLTHIGNDVRGSLSTHGDAFNEWFNASADSARPVLAMAFDDGGEQYVEIANREGLWYIGFLTVSAWGTRQPT